MNNNTVVFAHKGYVGIQTFKGAPGLITGPSSTIPGYLFDATYVDIQPQALALLKDVVSGYCDVGDVDSYRVEPDEDEVNQLLPWEDKLRFGWLGKELHIFKPKWVEGNKDYNPHLLSSKEGVVTPQSFIDTVERIISTES